MIFLDTETCGLHGPIILIQYAEDDGPIKLHNVWSSKISDTLDLLKWFTTQDICGFNLAFDWFHICQLYTTLKLLNPRPKLREVLDDYIKHEPLARDGQCLKPKSACDLMLHARKGPYQSTMDRSDIRIKKIPTVLAEPLAVELSKRIQFNDIYFARLKKAKENIWEVEDFLDADDEPDPNFKNIVVRFAPSSALKALAVDALGIDLNIRDVMSNIEIPDEYQPLELGYAPFAKAVMELDESTRLIPKNKRHKFQGPYNGAWPQVIDVHIDHWENNERARKYASDDVRDTRDLYEYFERPEPGDVDSELACMVGAVRWRGYAVDLNAVKELRDAASKRTTATINVNSANAVLDYLHEVMDPIEAVVVRDTSVNTLEDVANWDSPAAARAQEVIDARKAAKEVELYDKLIAAKRLHASFKIIGTRSTRMSGADGLNPQGIKKTKTVRSCFPLAWPGQSLCGGDFDAFEVVIYIATANDSQLTETVESGKKIHAIFGTYMYDTTYDAVKDSEGSSNDMYTKAKSGVFAKIYGGTAYTLHKRLGISEEQAERAERRFETDYPGIKSHRENIEVNYSPLTQPAGIGTQVKWREPQRYVESLLGFRRYFDLEFEICRNLFDLAQNPPKEWRSLNIKVRRTDRTQTASGAVQSALYGAAFGIQGSVFRAAANHVIQSTGAEITKDIQHALWQLQPSGISEFKVMPMNVHDEILCPTSKGYEDRVNRIVEDKVEELKSVVPLLSISWKTDAKHWADLKT